MGGSGNPGRDSKRVCHAPRGNASLVGKNVLRLDACLAALGPGHAHRDSLGPPISAHPQAGAGLDPSGCHPRHRLGGCCVGNRAASAAAALGTGLQNRPVPADVAGEIRRRSGAGLHSVCRHSLGHLCARFQSESRRAADLHGAPQRTAVLCPIERLAAPDRTALHFQHAQFHYRLGAREQKRCRGEHDRGLE